MSPHTRRIAALLLPLALALAGCAGPGPTGSGAPAGGPTIAQTAQSGDSAAAHGADAAATGAPQAPGQESAQPAPAADGAGAATPQESPAGVPATQDLDSYLEAQGLGQARRDGQVTVVGSLDEARSSRAQTTYIVVSDGTSHVVFTRDLTAQSGADATVEVGATTYGTTFTEVVPLIAYDVGADATSAISAAIEAAAAKGLGLRLGAGQRYAITGSLTIPDGLPFLDGAGATLDAAIPGGSENDLASALVLATGSSGTTVADMVLDLRDSPLTRGIQGDALSDTTISGISMLGVTHVGINLAADAGPMSSVTIRNNRIENAEGTPERKGEGASIQVNSARQETDKRYTSSASPVWDRYTTDGTVSPNRHSNTGMVITGNIIDGGYYGIGVSGLSRSTISRNTVRNTVRAISMQNHSSSNTVEGNYLSEPISSAVHVAYDSDSNTVSGNTVVSHRAAGQGLLQAYQSSDHNAFTGNRITILGRTRPSWVLYTATGSSSTSFTGNIITGSANHALIGVESIWDGASAASNLPAGTARNPWSYMHQGSLPSPVDNRPVPYHGGRGDLEGVTVQDNVLVDSGTSVPLVYAGAEVSKGRTGKEALVGDVTGLSVTGNRVVGGPDQPAVTHEGSLAGVGGAHVSGDLSVGTVHTGATTQSGQGGDDVFVLDSEQDSVTDTGGTDTAYATISATAPQGVEVLVLLGDQPLQATGNDSANTLTGNPADNALLGGDGDDTLSGGEGADTLTGGAGADTFTFDALVDGSTDTITDFAPGQDRVAVSATAFGALEGQWFAQAGATTPATRIIQDGTTLYLDADGSGGAYEPVAFATLPDGVQLGAGDFDIVP